ncbi:acyl-CoA dehydrogenase [Pseudomonas sp. C2L12B]|uniref:Dibenzothiophene monooxygenase n=2 Tax=Pseudomonas typographi TaxID=2715964 RepID=A0ABR7YX28_9PSED|nr:acyl-CoA dehydrogenase [Pseudomonas typographi]MBD1597746.1 acyl-CoA dehydrogenase [Pseudomonas typographi]
MSMAHADAFIGELKALCATIAKGAAERDQQRQYPLQAIAALRALGFWRLNVPVEYGGLGFDQQVLVQALALLAAADGSLGQIPQNHFNAVERLRLAGTPAQREHYLGRVGAGDFFGNATAEPGESHPGQAQTALRREGEQWRLDGHKVYATGALLANHISVQALDAAGQVVSVIVDRQHPGVEVIDDWDGLGQRTTASGSARFTAVPVQPLAIVRLPGDPQVAYRIAAQSQLLHAAIDVGLAEAALEQAIALARQVHGGRGSGAAAFADDALGVSLLGELALETRAARRLTEAAGRLLALLSPASDLREVLEAYYEVAQAKILSTRAVLSVTSKLYDIGGTRAARQGNGLDRYWRDARTHTLHDAVRWKPHALGRWLLQEAVADPWSVAHPYRPLAELQAKEPTA